MKKIMSEISIYGSNGELLAKRIGIIPLKRGECEICAAAREIGPHSEARAIHDHKQADSEEG